MGGRKLARPVWVKNIPGKGCVRAKVLKRESGSHDPETAVQGNWR